MPGLDQGFFRVVSTRCRKGFPYWGNACCLKIQLVILPIPTPRTNLPDKTFDWRVGTSRYRRRSFPRTRLFPFPTPFPGPEEFPPEKSQVKHRPVPETARNTREERTAQRHHQQLIADSTHALLSRSPSPISLSRQPSTIKPVGRSWLDHPLVFSLRPTSQRVVCAANSHSRRCLSCFVSETPASCALPFESRCQIQHRKSKAKESLD